MMMNMKEHILAALREQFDRWEELLGGLSEEQITTPQFDLDWSIKDVVAHLWGWQQTSIARMEAAGEQREPELPRWIGEASGDWEEDADKTNARIYETFHHMTWAEVYQDWREGFLRLIELGEPIPERDLLDSDRCAWLRGYSPAFILVASYEHHQEHLDKLSAWLEEHEM